MSLARSNDQLQTVLALGGSIEEENIGRFLGKPCIWRPLLNAQENKETTAMLADKIFLRELISVLFCQIRNIIAVIDPVIETCAKFPCRISIISIISIICLGFSD